MTWRRTIRRLARDQRGATFLEYMILVAVIALAAVPAFTSFGKAADKAVRKQGTNPAMMGF